MSEVETVTMDHEIQTRRAPLAASTWNAETRQFEVVFATEGAAVTRFDMQGEYIELLAVDGFRDADGVPFLDNHRRDSLDDQLGVVLSASLVGREARAVVRLSRHNHKADRLAGELEDGVRLGISVGYSVKRWKASIDPKSGVRTKTATQWSVHEISVTPVPADRRASTRSESSMTVESQPAGTPANPNPASETPETAVAERAAVTIENRAEINSQIRSMARPLGFDQAWIDQQIDANVTVEQARQAALNTMIERGAQGNLTNHRAEVGTDYSDPVHLRSRFGEAIYSRLNRDHKPSDAARQYVRMSLGEMAEEVARIRGIRRDGQTRNQFLVRMMTTSDFVNILEDGGHRVMRDHHRVLGSALKQLGRQVSAPDFRPLHSLQLSEGQLLEKVNEHGEIKAGKFIDAKESFSVDKLALRFGLTDRVIINDDVGLVEQMGRRFGEIAAATEADILVKLLTANNGGGPKMSDGKNVFHADHGNLGAPGLTPWLTASDDVAVLAAIRTAMRRQKGLQGQPISVTPKFLVVPPEGEAWGEKVLATISPGKIGDANPFANSLQLVVEPRLTDPKAWYVVGDPASAPALEYAHIDGHEGPTLESRAGWEIEGVEFKLKITFGAGFIDHRGWYRNPGNA